ncbi:MAG: hypothetical protein NC548_46880 [Lachnospiraceae bacterium]|nr:hypothetical protein [Lachnospiraceae bacterium]
MKEIILEIIKRLSNERAEQHKDPPGCDALSIQRALHQKTDEILNELENEGVLKSYPTVNGIKVYSFKQIQ